jgi:hypothetical protein
MTGTDRNIPTTPATSPPASRRGMDPASHDEGDARVVLDSPPGFAPVTREVRPAERASYPVGRLAEEQEAAWIGEVSCVRIGIEAFRPHGLFTVSGGMMLRRGREGGQRRSAPGRRAQARGPALAITSGDRGRHDGSVRSRSRNWATEEVPMIALS